MKGGSREANGHKSTGGRECGTEVGDSDPPVPPIDK